MGAKSSNHKPIIRKVDGVGRISIPPKVLDHLDIEEGSSALLYMEDNNKIILKKNVGECVFCGSKDIVVHLSEIEICANCRQNPEKVSAIVDKRYENQIIPNGRRLVIPYKIRKYLGIETGDKIEILKFDKYLEMKKYIEE